MDKNFVDSGISSQPEYAFWDIERGWSIENRGVDPDIEVVYRPEDYIAGRDPQLERGIAELMKKIQEQPVQRPTPPPFPDKSGRDKAAAAGSGGGNTGNR
jgi:tricorn protease